MMFARFLFAVLGLASVLAVPHTRWWSGDHWVDIWNTAPLVDVQSALPKDTRINGTYPGAIGVFNDTTIRQTFRMTLGADTIRITLSNEFSEYPLNVTCITAALTQANASGVTSGQPTIQQRTLQTVTFSGNNSFQVYPNAVALSDPVSLSFGPSTDITVSIYLQNGQEGYNTTAHAAAHTTTWLGQGDQSYAGNITNGLATTQWFFASRVQGWLGHNSRAMVAVGDSITDGTASTTDGNTRWLDQLFHRAQQDDSTKDIAMLNQGIGGNTVVRNKFPYGLDTVARLGSDILMAQGLTYVLVFEGTNDIGSGDRPNTTEYQDQVYNQLIFAYEQIITRVHQYGIPVFGATITPFGVPPYSNSTFDYDEPARENTRTRVNDWILNSGKFDYVVDFAAAVANQSTPTQMQDQFESGDWLHPNVDGYRAMAEAFDLSVFERFAGGVNSFV